LQEAARETQALNGCAHGSRGCPAGRAADPRPCASQALQVLSSPGGL